MTGGERSLGSATITLKPGLFSLRTCAVPDSERFGFQRGKMVCITTTPPEIHYLHQHGLRDRLDQPFHPLSPFDFFIICRIFSDTYTGLSWPPGFTVIPSLHRLGHQWRTDIGATAPHDRLDTQHEAS